MNGVQNWNLFLCVDEKFKFDRPEEKGRGGVPSAL